MSLFSIPDSNPWTTIQDFIDQICSFQTITPQMTMDTYAVIFNYYCGYAFRSARPVRSRKNNEFDENLYQYTELCLQNKLKHICQNMNDMQDEDILRLYHNCWSQYKSMSYILNSGCYLIAKYVHLHRNGIDKYDGIDALSEHVWEVFFFKPLLSTVARACLNLIKACRNQKSSDDRDLIKKTIEMYMDENFNFTMKKILNTDPTIDSISNIYEKYLQIELLIEAEEFCRQQTMPILVFDSTITYLTAVVGKLSEVADSPRIYLPRATLEMLLKQSEDILVPDDKLNLILDKLKTLAWTENYEELANLYKPINRIRKIKNHLIKLIESCIYEHGNQQLDDIHPVILDNLEQYIQTIYKIFIKCLPIIRESFRNDSEFLVALDTGFARLVNTYSITGTNDAIIKLPELLARCCDVLLRKGSKDLQEIDFEDKIKQMMFVFNYVEDKDIFFEFYQKMLTKRLINQTSTSDDNEELILSKLKQTCGSDYTSKLQQMFQDIRISKTLIEQYKTHNRLDINFSVMILSSNAWPFSTSSNIILPFELQSPFDRFKVFYDKQYNGRKLIWLYQYSKGELQTLFTNPKYHLQVSIHQMIVLLLFNKSSMWTVQRIEDETELKGDLLLQTISSLLKSRLITCSGINEDFTDTDIHLNSIVRLSGDFQNEKIRINLMKSIKQKELETIHRTIDEDRTLIIQAAIIRIMKARKVQKHILLMQEVIDQLKCRFQPKIPLIKKCVDILIEKEYIRRQTNEKDILEYIA